MLQTLLNGGGEFIVEDIVKQLVLYLRYGISNSHLLFRGALTAAAEATRFFDAVFRLLVTMLSSGQIRRGMGLGGPAPGYADMGQYSQYLFRLVMAIRGEVLAVTGAATERLLVKIDLTVSLFLQHAYAARKIILQGVDQEQPDDSTEGSLPRHTLFETCIQVVAQAAEFLVSQPTSSNARESAPDISSARKSSLKAVNSRLGKAVDNGIAVTSSVSVVSVGVGSKLSHPDSLAAASNASTVNVQGRNTPSTANKGGAASTSGKVSVSVSTAGAKSTGHGAAGAGSTVSNRWYESFCYLYCLPIVNLTATVVSFMVLGAKSPEATLSVAVWSAAETQQVPRALEVRNA